MTSVFNVFDYVMENDVNLLKICVDMADQEPIDPSKMIGGRRAQTQSYRKEKERRNAHIPKRGRGRRGGDGSGSSQPSEASQAPPEESQVVDPTQAVEYLNYQDHHDVTDGGYDEQYMPEQPHMPEEPDEDDIAAAAAPEVLPTDAPFPGGPQDISLLHSYASHVALPLWYNKDDVSIFFFLNVLSLCLITCFLYVFFYMCFFICVFICVFFIWMT
jgi:hypothetical protein